MANPRLPVHRGFTLMELLIALSLFSIITGFLMSSFFQFHQQSGRTESILALRQELRILEQIIRKDLQAVIYLEEYMKDPQQDQDGRKSGIYGINYSEGARDSDQLHLHLHAVSKFHRTVRPEHDPEIHEVSYFLEENDHGDLQFKRREEFYLDPDMTEGQRSIVHTLSNRIVSFDVKYYKGAEEEALEEWDSSSSAKPGDPVDNIPAGILVTLAIESDDGERLMSEMQINLRPAMGQNVSWR